MNSVSRMTIHSASPTVLLKKKRMLDVQQVEILATRRLVLLYNHRHRHQQVVQQAEILATRRLVLLQQVTQQNFSFLGLDNSVGGDGDSSFGLDNTSFGIVTNSTSRRNRLDFSALHQSSNAFTVDSSLSLGLGILCYCCRIQWCCCCCC